MVVLLISRFIFIPEQRNMLKPIPNIKSADPKFGCLKIRKKIVAKKIKVFRYHSSYFELVLVVMQKNGLLQVLFLI